MRHARLLTRSLSGAAALLVVVGALLFAQGIATRRAVDAQVAQGRTEAVLLASGFRRELEKFRLSTVVLARDPDAQAALRDRTPAAIATLNRKFEALNAEMAAAALYLLDLRGTTLAASNWRSPTSFVGLNYGFRAYFTEASRAGSARQFALGTRSRTPGLYLAQRVDDVRGAMLGIIVVKLEFQDLEAEWRATGKPAFATNRRGIILVTSVPDWRFQTTAPLDKEARRAILDNLEFGTAPLRPNALFASGRVALAGSAEAGARPLVQTVEKVDDDWSVHVLTSTRAPVAAALVGARLIVLTLTMAIAAIVALFIYRRRAAVAAFERAATGRVEALKLRLAQANKLATLGQIAAGVGHEINQPVTAIGAYAHNGALLMDAGRNDEARANLVRIGVLTQSIGQITGELRGFARRATGNEEAVVLDDAIGGALLLLGDRIRSSGARIVYAPPSGLLSVRAERVRLEQVLVNLLQNALDAGGERSTVTVSIAVVGATVEVAIRDDGPGLTAQARAGLFQPFSTTKVDGLGLGLVISRDIMVDLGGDLLVLDPPRGAEFVVILRWSGERP